MSLRHRYMWMPVGLLAAGFLSVPTMSLAQEQPAGTAAQTEIAQKISEDVTDVEIDVAVEGQTAVLSGTAPTLWAKRRAVAIALETEGIEEVQAEITVPGGDRSAEDIAQDVAREVRQYVFFTMFDDVSVGVDNGVVQLTGAVTDPYKKDDIEERASRVVGVQDIVNDIQELPASSQDDRLRVALARRIYNDPRFLGLANQVTPPIHIIVANARVTLTGVVNSEIDKRLIDSIVRSTFGVLSVENQLRIGS